MILNYNPAITSNFKITIPGEQKLEFYAHSVNIPTITLSPIEVPYQDSRIKVPDNRYIWDDLTIQFILDEDLYSYELLRDWLIKVRSEDLWQKGRLKRVEVSAWIRMNLQEQRPDHFQAKWLNKVEQW